MRRRPLSAFRAVCVLAAAAGAGALAACETVNLGNPPADINSCRPSQMFFASDIWPKVLAQEYNGQHCYDSSCHASSAGRPLSLTVPLMATPPIPFPMDWAANYRSASEHMNCTNVKASELLTLPSGLRTHGGKKLFEPDGPEALLIQMWPSVQP